MQHIIQDWKEKKRAEFKDYCNTDNFSNPPSQDEANIISEWFLSQLPSLFTFLEEEVKYDQVFPSGYNKLKISQEISGINHERQRIRTLLAVS